MGVVFFVKVRIGRFLGAVSSRFFLWFLVGSDLRVECFFFIELCEVFL